MESLSEAANYALRFVNQTSRSVFLTGKAGTGKTTLLREIIRTTHKNTVVVAPTGIAALNAGGVTIHSMFQLPFAGFIPDTGIPSQVSGAVRLETRHTLRRHFKMSGLKKTVIRNMELLIIDEVSMLRADLLDAIDFMMQTVRKRAAPFGGVQVLYIGDLLQLPPVIKNEEWDVLRKYYAGKFFFHSHVVQQNPPLYIELSTIYRQTESAFINILNNLRNNQISDQDMQVLNAYVQPSFDLKEHSGYILLTTHNSKADAINNQALQDLDGKMLTFEPEIVGEFPEKIFPVEPLLKLKVGAQVMFVKNDPSPAKNFFNGKTGVIKSLSDGEIHVYFEQENVTIEVERYEWQNIRYYVDSSTKDIAEEVLGTFVHYPIKLAWAITVHKSQGLTFSKAAVDVSQVFLPGQAYVALSRLRSLEGLILLSPLQMNGISNDSDVMLYSENKADVNSLGQSLQDETLRFVHDYLRRSFDWSNLLQEWRNHRFSYDDEAKASEKGKSRSWALRQLETLENLQQPAHAFRTQLDRLFGSDPVDLPHVSQRIEAAIGYFFPVLDAVVTELLQKLEQVRRAKKAKTFLNELYDLEEMQTKAVLQLFRARLMIRTVASGDEICKENLDSADVRTYRSSKIDSLREELGHQSDHFRDETAVPERKARKKPKEPKKSTVQETHELWLQKLTIKEIAARRKLTPQTIGGHIAKLIESETVLITDVLPEEKIAELENAFKGYTSETLHGLKELHGDKFTWDELKMFKASLAAGVIK